MAIITPKLVATAIIKTLSPTGGGCPEYNLIDGGGAGTTYAPINGFDLISGGGA
jgi:hypothetical protein